MKRKSTHIQILLSIPILTISATVELEVHPRALLIMKKNIELFSKDQQ